MYEMIKQIEKSEAPEMAAISTALSMMDSLKFADAVDSNHIAPRWRIV